MIGLLGSATLLLSPAAVVTARPASNRAALLISETFDRRSGFPVEGFMPYLAIDRSSDHSAVLEAAFPGLERAGHRVRVNLVPGVFEIHRYMRVCDGNCGLLDPPSAVCALRLRVRAGQRIMLRIRASFLGCSIRRRG
jgi:hypothetical protein